jgi:6-phosphogluconolactonase
MTHRGGRWVERVLRRFAALVPSGCAAACAGSPDLQGGAEGALRVWVGTYTGSGSRGIYTFDLDPSSGRAVSAPVLAAASESPSFLVFHPSGRVLYAVNEVGSYRGRKSGAVSAFAVDSSTGKLALLSQQPSEGADPCHLAVDREGRHLLVANYTGGSVALLPVEADGRLRPASRVMPLVGTGPNAARQQASHAHGVFLDPGERFALIVDLGADRVAVDRFDGEYGEEALGPHEPGVASLPPGSGPRHLAWHPSGRALYVINELFSTVAAFRWDPERGSLEPYQTVPAVADGFSGDNKAAEIAVSPGGGFLYVSNRGDDALTVFAIDPSGRLAHRARVPSGGRTPRHFAIDPSGRWLIVANQDSDTVVVFRLDRETGLPRAVGTPLAVPAPACIAFAPAGDQRS